MIEKLDFSWARVPSTVHESYNKLRTQFSSCDGQRKKQKWKNSLEKDLLYQQPKSWKKAISKGN